MGIFDFFKFRVYYDDVDVIGIVTHYKGKPFTGTLFSKHENGKIASETEIKKGLNNGLMKSYYENGQLKEEKFYKKGELQGSLKTYNEKGELTITSAEEFKAKQIKEEEKQYQKIRQDKINAEEKEIENLKKKYVFGNVKEIIELIKSNPNIKIFIEANEYWDGVYQLKEDKESDSIEHFSITDYNEELAVSVNNGEVTVGEDYKGYNLKKKAYEDRYYIWAKALIDNEDLLKSLNEFLEEDNYDDNSDLLEFFEYFPLPQTPDEAISYFENTNYEEGIGTDIGIDNICWSAEVYVRQAGVELYSLDL